MNSKNRFLFLIAFFMLSTTYSVLAQSMESTYKTSLGAKVLFGSGTVGGLNVKHFINDQGALEGSLLFLTGGLGIDVLYEYHGEIADAPGLQWYAGGGGTILFPTNEYGSTLFALHPVLGIDYKFKGAPINVALDANPLLYIVPDVDFDFYLGLAFRFAL